MAPNTVYEDTTLFAQVQQALKPYENVVLLLPSPDPVESLRVLSDRCGCYAGTEIDRMNEHYLTHHCNYDLSKLTVYTDGKSPEESCAEILSRIRHRPGLGTGLRTAE